MVSLQSLSNSPPHPAHPLLPLGLPPPHSSDLAKQCEQILRSQGVTPATIAILNGRIKVGLSEKDLEELAEKGWASRKTGKGMWKVGRREIGAAVVKVSLSFERIEHVGGKNADLFSSSAGHERRYDCQRDDGDCAFGRDQGLFDWRHRRSSPWSGNE